MVQCTRITDQLLTFVEIPVLALAASLGPDVGVSGHCGHAQPIRGRDVWPIRGPRSRIQLINVTDVWTPALTGTRVRVRVNDVTIIIMLNQTTLLTTLPLISS